MGQYNPYVPQILGQEWVGIREVDMSFTPAVNSVEVGHSFTTAASHTLLDVRFYINEWPPGRSLGQVFLGTIYPRGEEDQTGPVQSVVIPANSIVLAGGATGTVADLQDPSDNSFLIFPRAGSGGVGGSVEIHFATNSYSLSLTGKRIVGVNFLYTLAANSGQVGTAPSAADLGNLAVEDTSNGAVGLGAGQAAGSLLGLPELFKAEIGEIDHWWGGAAPNGTGERLPWRYQGLQDFEATSANRIRVVYEHPLNATWDGRMSYAALEVLYCEENRLLYGGNSFGASGFATGHTKYVMGTNIITMRDLAYAASPVLAPGGYTLVISSANLGDCAGPTGLFQRKINLSRYPLLNGLRQLYAMPAHPGIQVNVTQAIGKTFTSEETQVLPQLSLHTSGGPLTEVHVYGRQAAAQVYNSVYAAQEIYDAPVLGAASYPWVRYYARRFGDTVVPLRLSTTSPPISGSSVEITPTDFDAIDEIVDGWKEVTLRFDTPPVMGTGSTPQWRWTATGEAAGNRWEVLGTYAPALSGITGNLLNRVPSPNQLSIATYGAPVSGANVNLSWVPQYAPPVSATVDDETADATLIFATDPAVITGFGASVETQEMVGIGLNCGLDPCCIPTALDYVGLTWGLPVNTGAFTDDFTRTEAAGSWGGTYALFGTATDYSVNGEQGVVTFSANNSSRFATVNIGAVDFDVKAEFVFQATIASGTIRAGVVGRFTAAGDNYLTSVDVTPDGAVTLTMEERVGGGFATIASSAIPRLSGGLGANLTVRMVGLGTFLKAKAWQTGYPEPSAWDLEVNDSSLTVGSEAGVFLRDNSAVTGHVIEVDNLVVTPPQPWFGSYELQRMDTVTNEWQTIMKATSPAVTAFSDYEARVGILSSYRIRAVDVYDFTGPWSDTVTATVPEPGVTIGCEGGHLLIFTSNEEQDGSLNLAYSSVWENRVEESFVFPEARFVELQAMYNRDFFTAFRPTERGGEQFSRTVLVQAAAIDPETLADFTSLRDMAWADVPYICVRDEDGNRWFATVLVPGGKVVHNRRLYMAPVEIIEVTDTPSEVDP